MKIRTGFVSNSSSSSFILIDAYGDTDPQLEANFSVWVNEHIVSNKKLGQNVFAYVPTQEFGWQFEAYNEMWDKLDFMLLQSRLTGKYDDDYAKHKTALLEFFQQYNSSIGKVCVLNKLYDEEYDYNEYMGYIDHQSVGGENLDMMESVDSIRHWLFSPKSYILCGNDNDYRKWDLSGEEPKLVKDDSDDSYYPY